MVVSLSRIDSLVVPHFQFYSFSLLWGELIHSIPNLLLSIGDSSQFCVNPLEFSVRVPNSLTGLLIHENMVVCLNQSPTLRWLPVRNSDPLYDWCSLGLSVRIVMPNGMCPFGYPI